MPAHHDGEPIGLDTIAEARRPHAAQNLPVLRRRLADWSADRLVVRVAPSIFTRSFYAAPTRGGEAARTEGPPSSKPAIRFGRFLLVPGSRALFRDGLPIELGSRAFDLLHVLVRFRGSVVGKAEMMRTGWPGLTVEDSNLRFQMACLRRALASDRDIIKTVTGRGYLLVDDDAATDLRHGRSAPEVITQTLQQREAA